MGVKCTRFFIGHWEIPPRFSIQRVNLGGFKAIIYNLLEILLNSFSLPTRQWSFEIGVQKFILQLGKFLVANRSELSLQLGVGCNQSFQLLYTLICVIVLQSVGKSQFYFHCRVYNFALLLTKGQSRWTRAWTTTSLVPISQRITAQIINGYLLFQLIFRALQLVFQLVQNWTRQISVTIIMGQFSEHDIIVNLVFLVNS